MSIAQYREAKATLAKFDAFTQLLRKPEGRIEFTVAARLKYRNGSGYPEEVKDTWLEKLSAERLAEIQTDLLLAYRDALVARIATLHRAAVVEAAAIITEEPTQ